MSQVIDMERGRLQMAVKRGYRNWKGRFQEDFDQQTRLSDLSLQTLAFLAQGKEKGTFYLYDLIMNLKWMGSGFEFNELGPKQKMIVIDQYLFLLDRIRFECMKRMGWLEGYPGEDFPLVELITRFEELAPNLQAKVPVLSQSHPKYGEYADMGTFDQEAFIRKLIPKAVRDIGDYSKTL
jgi:hypothetical protein